MKVGLRYLFFVLLGLLLIMVVYSCDKVGEEKTGAQSGVSDHWGYEGEESPDHWAELTPEFIKCAEGHQQSPIDIESLHAEHIDGTSIRFDYHPSLVDEVNNGHTIQINPEEKNSVYIADQEFELIQFHFHEPSEHHIDGIIYPMEMHLVHRNQQGTLAVVGIFIKEGSENQYLSDLWNQLPEAVNNHYHPENRCDLTHILPNKKEAFHYSGSLTTPPCSEGVEWYVFEEPINMSREQIDHFRKVYHNNNRPIQR